MTPAAYAYGSFSTTTDGQILDPTGEPFLPIGFHITVPSLGDNGSAATRADEAISLWGINTVYLDVGVVDDPSLPSWWPARTRTTTVTYQGESMPQWKADIAALVDEYTAAGLVTVVVSRDALQAGNANPGVASSTHLTDFYTWLVTRYATNPYVWVNPHCEPPYWDQPWCDIHNLVINAVRSAGYVGPIILDPPGAGQDVGPEYTVYNTNGTTWLEQVTGNENCSGIANKTGVINGVHWYGWPTWQRTVDAAKSYVSNHTSLGYPVLLGEFGCITQSGAWGAADASTIDRVKATHVAFDLIRGGVVGGVWWHGHHQDGFYLHTGGQFWTVTAGTMLWSGQKLLDVIGAQV